MYTIENPNRSISNSLIVTTIKDSISSSKQFINTNIESIHEYIDVLDQNNRVKQYELRCQKQFYMNELKSVLFLSQELISLLRSAREENNLLRIQCMEAKIYSDKNHRNNQKSRRNRTLINENRENDMNFINQCEQSIKKRMKEAFEAEKNIINLRFNKVIEEHKQRTTLLQCQIQQLSTQNNKLKEEKQKQELKHLRNEISFRNCNIKQYDEPMMTYYSPIQNKEAHFFNPLEFTELNKDQSIKQIFSLLEQPDKKGLQIIEYQKFTHFKEEYTKMLEQYNTVKSELGVLIKSIQKYKSQPNFQNIPRDSSNAHALIENSRLNSQATEKELTQSNPARKCFLCLQKEEQLRILSRQHSILRQKYQKQRNMLIKMLKIEEIARRQIKQLMKNYRQ